MNRGTSTVADLAVQGDRKGRPGQRSMVLALLVVVVALDQATKWWAWRHAPRPMINDGGNVLVGEMVSGWYSDPVTGALLDLLDFGLLSTAVFLLMCRRCPLVVLVPGALMIAGWSSNLLDRLGLHYWTAPGSARGAVDFVHLGHHFYNVADLFIIAATPLFLLAAIYLGSRLSNRLSATRRQPRLRTRMSALVGAASLIVAVGIGATNDSGVTTPVVSPGASAR
jgi:lipoprotein signal peptidase